MSSEEKPSKREQKERERTRKAALERYLLEDAYRTVPKKHYKKLADTTDKVINKHGRHFGMPVLGPTVDLYQIVHWIHQFLGQHGYQLFRKQSDDALLFGESTPALEKLREVQFRYRLLELEQLRQNLVSRETMHAALAGIAARIRQAGDQLQKKFGADALEILNQQLAACEEIIENLATPQKDEKETDADDPDRAE